MNEKFFDLPREKQDRMINGALEVFAKNGFKHASTDDMVKTVGVSKGLWFHYFGSKVGIYVFVYDYSVKYLLLESSTVVDENEKDFFELTKQQELAKSRVSRSYPFLNMFLENAEYETDEELISQTLESRRTLHDKVIDLAAGAEINGIEDKAKRDRIKKITSFTISGIIKEKTAAGAEPETVYREIRSYIDLIKDMTQ